MRGKGIDFADVLGSANPGDGAFQTQAEAGVRHAAVAAQVEIPLEGFLGQIVFAQPLDQQVVARNALAAADDFAVALRRQHVEAQRQLGPHRVGLHVERFDRGGIAMNHDRAVELVRENGLFVAAEIVAPLRGIAVLLQNLDGLIVGEARKRRLHGFELGDVAPKRFEFAAALADHRLHDVADQAFAERHHVFEVRVGGLGLEHPEFGQVAARLRFFGAKCGPESVDLAERRRDGFEVKLARLREVGFFLVHVLHLEERGGAFARGWSEDRRVGQRVALRVHEFARGANGFGANAQNRGLARRANPEVAAVEQKIDAVLLELDRIRLGFRDALHDFDARDAHLAAARRARLAANPSGDDDARFLRQSAQRGERFGLLFLRDHALQDAGAVAKNREEQLAGFALVIEPAADGDFLVQIFGDAIDGDDGHCSVMPSGARRPLLLRRDRRICARRPAKRKPAVGSAQAGCSFNSKTRAPPA